MKQDELAGLLEAARDYHAPPEAPREEMWAAIRERVQAAGNRRAGSDLDAARERRDRRERMRRWTPWALGLAAAATLTVGFGLGRIAERSAPGLAPSAPTDGPASSLPVQLAAADHMGEVEAMLTLYRTSDRADDRQATARWARELLTTTRLLLDSRAGDDPKLADLLQDLELVLVQIASAGAGDEAGQEIIEEGIERRQLLPKLRSATRPLETAL